MKRFFSSLKADFIFQWKHGFYSIYLVLLILYYIILQQLPSHIIAIVLPIIVYIDPSVLGLFFIGGIILLERQQGILQLLYVTPLRVREYLLSKIISLSLIAVLVGTLLSLLVYNEFINVVILIIGITTTSLFYTLVGLLVSIKVTTVNAYFIKIIPYLLLLVIPCFTLLLANQPIIYNIFPTVASLKLIFLAYEKSSLVEALLLFFYVMTINIWLFARVEKAFTTKMIFNE